MTLQEDVKYIENHLDQAQSVEQLRTFLAQKRLKLVVVLISKDSTCVEWNITQKQVCKVLDLGLRIRISRISDESELLETIHSVPIRVKEANWVDLDDLFEVLKQEITKCIKNAELTNKNGN